MLHLGAASIQAALLPMLGLLALACVQGVRYALPRATMATPTARTPTPIT